MAQMKMVGCTACTPFFLPFCFRVSSEREYSTHYAIHIYAIHIYATCNLATDTKYTKKKVGVPSGCRLPAAPPDHCTTVGSTTVGAQPDGPKGMERRSHRADRPASAYRLWPQSSRRSLCIRSGCSNCRRGNGASSTGAHLYTHHRRVHQRHTYHGIGQSGRHQ